MPIQAGVGYSAFVQKSAGGDGPEVATRGQISANDPVISVDRSSRLGEHTIVSEPGGAAMDVGGWLRRLGLEEYEAAFRENKIDDTVLPSLTAEDLKDLGVGFVGHRRKLLDAIAALRAEASEPAPVSAPPLESDNIAKDAAERRQVTVMFSDLVGSTALSARMDPEDLREVISSYQKTVAETVQRFGGFASAS